MTKRLTYLFFIVCFGFTAHAKDYTFGVVPQQSANVLANRWVPLTQYLSKKTGLNIQFATANTIPVFEQRLLEQQYDIAYMNPFHYVVFAKHAEYVAINHQSDKKIQGIIVARKDSHIFSLADLTDTTVAFPAPAAFAATMLPRAELDLAQIPITPQFVSSHDSVYLNVHRGFFSAGGGVKRTFNNMPDAIKADLKVVWTTQPYTPHAFAVLNNMPTAHREAIQTALAEMGPDPQGSAILQKLGMRELQRAIDSDWDDVRALNLNENLIK